MAFTFNTQGNFWDSRAGDGRNRAHVPGMPKWTAFIRIAQLVLAFLLLILEAYAASKLGSDAAGFGLTFFSFILTLGLIVYLGVSIIIAPHVYNVWAHLALEALCVIFWLCSWAVLASYAAAWNGFDYYYGYGYFYYGGSLKSAINCVKAGAALGALEWVLFCITFAFFVLALLAHRKNTVGAGAGVHTETKPVGGPVVGGAPHEMAPIQHQTQQTYPTQDATQQYQQPATYPQEPQTYQQGPYVEGQQQQQPYAEGQQQQTYPQGTTYPQAPAATHQQQSPYPQ